MVGSLPAVGREVGAAAVVKASAQGLQRAAQLARHGRFEG